MPKIVIYITGSGPAISILALFTGVCGLILINEPINQSISQSINQS